MGAYAGTAGAILLLSEGARLRPRESSWSRRVFSEGGMRRDVMMRSGGEGRGKCDWGVDWR